MRGLEDIHLADVDGDGDMDVLSAYKFDNKIAWYANDGSGGFSPEQVIATNVRSVRAVYTADIDGDGDLDVLSASNNDNKIAWYSNLGSGNFSAQQIISLSANGALDVHAADVDGDGDMDVLSASDNDNKVAWYANNGSGFFGSQQVIESWFDDAAVVYTSDIDGDGDLDVLSGTGGFTNGRISWYPNLSVNCAGPSTTIQISGNTMTATATGATYQWLDCGNGGTPIAGATNAVFMPPTSGTYAVEVTQNGCTNTSTCVLYTTIAVQQLSTAALMVNTYPNPTHGALSLDLGTLEAATITVYTASGQVVQQRVLQGQGVHEMHLEGAAGIYFLKIEVDNRLQYHKIIKQ